MFRDFVKSVLIQDQSRFAAIISFRFPRNHFHAYGNVLH